jgi:hypothetical protein
VSVVETERTTSPAGPLGSALSWLDSPLKVGGVAGALAAAFTLARFAVAAHGNVAAFIVVGEQHADAAQLPRGVPVRSVAGYDGQFYYRLALDPLDWSRRAFGIKLDSYGRVQRIAYSVFAWLTAGGQSAAVPVTLVVVNVSAIGALAGVCGALAREAKRHPLWGLMIAGYWGFLWTISRDLTELVETLFVCAGILAIRKGRPVLAAIFLSVAVLSRETVLLLLAAIFLARLISQLPRLATRLQATGPGSELPGPPPIASSPGRGTGVRWRPGTEDLTWIVPVLVFAAWQAAVLARTHHLPIHASGDANAGIPFVGMVDGLTHYLPRIPSTGALLWVGELGILTVVGALAAVSLSSTSAPLHERIAWIFYGILTVSLATGIWEGDVGFRSLDDFFVFSCILLLFSKVRLQFAGLLVAAGWVTVAVELARYI